MFEKLKNSRWFPANSAMVQLILTNLRELTRDKATFFFVMAFPSLLMLMFVALSQPDTGKVYTVGLVMPDNAGAEVGALVANLEKNPSLKLVRATETVQRDNLQKGTLNVVLVLPSQLSNHSDVHLLSNSDGSITSAALRSTIEGLTRPDTGPAITEEAVGKQQAYGSILYLLPGLLIMSFVSLSIFGLALPILILRQNGTLRLLGLTPLSPLTFVTAQILARLVLALGQLVIMLTFSYLLLNGFPLANLPGIVLSTVLGIVMMFALGYVLSEVIPSPEAAGGPIGGLVAPILLLTGILLPFSSLPDFILTIARFIPLTYLGDALRQQILGEKPIASLWVDDLVLFGTAAFLVVLAVRLFHWGQPDASTKKPKVTSKFWHKLMPIKF